MGVLFSKPATAESFEKALAAFDAQIRKVNIRLAELRPRETRALSSATLYGVAIWGILVAVAFNTSLHTPQLVDLGDGDVVQLDPDKWKTSLMRLVVLSIGPILVYYLRRIVSWYFRRATEKSNELLEALRTQQRAKIEELKEITAFYRAKELIERYEYLLDPNAVPVPPSYFMEQQQPQPDFQQQALAPQPPQSVAPNSSAAPSIADAPAPLLALEAPPLPDSAPVTADAPTSGWFAPLIDRLVAGGPETPDSEATPPLPPELTQYALICGMCFHHNGLALPNEFPTMVYVCRHCATLNDRGAMARGEPYLFQPVDKDPAAAAEEVAREAELGPAAILSGPPPTVPALVLPEGDAEPSEPHAVPLPPSPAVATRRDVPKELRDEESVPEVATEPAEKMEKVETDAPAEPVAAADASAAPKEEEDADEKDTTTAAKEPETAPASAP
ncbi:hypothetical protein AMAG_03599 [Allomyces macrogynus ATCC 38327]|uniref:Endoplasmic reticulum junction formation protein lunapark n=1 Tax=Allomyces macrogynus (strain ATCC 38327) TaxID=578462 RepID=A0A0L0S9L7_ALLM3|nr:hypothetical protein AMAG_03599 [Allomyces macrogynus ATCC 38327]|eukprot:KNE59293.1 hypothetical protein AMAG_03599 [Allomyces macrogynus ATCC 38327]